ncbi:DUF1330 domain-containing protein, partial [Loktanella sp. DJP18]|uniref:DUF1330 domain-containing protein n=1 Tax=Loktanella sp. DJP18 TaxID=3409788 RepID=UPI003BB4BC0D
NPGSFTRRRSICEHQKGFVFMNVIVLALVAVNDDEPQALALYLDVIGRLIAAAGARMISRFPVTKVGIGRIPAPLVILVEYPDRKAVDLVIQSDVYKAIGPIRDRAFSSFNMAIVAP